jgi:polysaccharide pyruvyl transferase WcaK-like protein
VAHRIRDAVLSGEPESAVSEANVGSMSELMHVLAESRCAIASRYHNVLAALSVTVPVISLSYAAKNDAVMTRMGLGDFRQSINAIDESLLLEQFERLERQRDALSVTIARRCAHERTLALRQLDEVSMLVETIAR